MKVIYYSQSGNTEQMAQIVARGIESANKEATIHPVSNISMEDIVNDDAFALGCPAMGAEVLEEAEMEPFVASIEPILAGKRIALFGSYGWGDGQWMREWEERMRNAGAIIVNDHGVICSGAPDGACEVECEELGKKLAQ